MPLWAALHGMAAGALSWEAQVHALAAGESAAVLAVVAQLSAALWPFLPQLPRDWCGFEF